MGRHWRSVAQTTPFIYGTRQTGESPRELRGHEWRIKGVAYSPEGNRISASADNTIRLWDVRTGEHLRTFEGHCGVKV